MTNLVRLSTDLWVARNHEEGRGGGIRHSRFYCKKAYLKGEIVSVQQRPSPGLEDHTVGVAGRPSVSVSSRFFEPLTLVGVLKERLNG